MLLDTHVWIWTLAAAKGTLSDSATALVQRAAANAPGRQPLSLTREALVQSTRLPGTVHGDPADRMLMAQAQLSGLSRLTCDRGIIDYASRERGIPVCDARG